MSDITFTPGATLPELRNNYNAAFAAYDWAMQTSGQGTTGTHAEDIIRLRDELVQAILAMHTYYCH